ncbi:hypothetical protein [Phocaeicola sp.]
MIELTYIIMFIFGILQIILFFKIWGMTNNVKDLKDLYAKRSEELTSSINALSKSIKDLKSPVGEQKSIIKEFVEVPKENKAINESQHEIIIEELPIIDENSDEFKHRLRKWKILKNKGYTDQAVKEYMEYTKRDRSIAVEFINTL